MSDHNDPRKWGWGDDERWVWGDDGRIERFREKYKSEAMRKLFESLLPRQEAGYDYIPAWGASGPPSKPQTSPKPAPTRKPRKKAALPEPPAQQPITHVKRFTSYDRYWFKKLGVLWEGEEEMNEAWEK